MVDVASGRVTRVTLDQTEDRFPAWTPDGRFLFFSSAREGTHAIWRIPLAGGAARRVTLGTGPEGRILRVTRSGEERVHFTVYEPMVTALAVMPGGDLLAGTTPEGRVVSSRPRPWLSWGSS